jgi:signal peptidase I
VPPYTPLPVRTRPFGCLFEIAETLILTVVIFLAIQTFVAQPYRVEQQSMQKTLDDGQYVLVDKLTPHFDDYSRGDIVIFHPPGLADSATPYIKRVIGVAGDRIELRAGHVLVNGAQIEENYTFDDQPTRALGTQTAWTLVPGQLFVMGDHRMKSTDSRAADVGPVPVANVIGRAWLRYWPLSKVGVLETPRYPDLMQATGRR